MAQSPGVGVTELDQVLNVAAKGADAGGGFVGQFVWGPVNQITSVSSPNNLLLQFGGPTDDTYIDYFSAENFLAYTSNLGLVRVVDSATALNACIGASNVGTGVLIPNAASFQAQQSSLTQYFAARYPGAKGTGLKVSLADSTTFTGWVYANQFDSAPNSSPNSVTFNANSDDEMHMVVVDSTGAFTGIPGAVLEKYPFVSKATDAKDSNGAQSYYISVLNKKSSYLYGIAPIGGTTVVDPGSTSTAIGGKLSDGKPMATLAAAYNQKMKAGNDGTTPTATAYINGYELFQSNGDATIQALFSGNAGGDSNHAQVVNAIADVCLATEDYVGFSSPKISDVLNVTSEATAITNISTTWGELDNCYNSYSEMDTGVKCMYDKYNDKFRWIPCNADTAGLWCASSNKIGPWMSAAGYNRGIMRNVVQLAFNPSPAARKTLAKMNINNIITEKGVGTLLLGDRTLQPKDSAFSSLGIRFLFMSLENIISLSAKYKLFEFNNALTQASFRQQIDPLLRGIKGKNGITDYMIVCDKTNNTNDVIQNGQFVGSIFIKPQYSIQFIQLNFIASDLSVVFTTTTK